MISEILIANPNEPAKRPHLEKRGLINIAGRQLKVEAAIAHGAFGDLYKARDTTSGQELAIKFVDLSMGSDPKVTVELALKEAEILQALGKIKHRALPKFFGAEFNGQTNEGLMLMEYIDGPPLEGMPHFDDENLARLIVEIGGALAQLHRPPPGILEQSELAGNALVHGDIKPYNIIISRDPQRPFVLIDYGISNAALHARQSKQPQALGAENILGSPLYVDPNFVWTKKILPASDVYSFAATILDMSLPGGLEAYLRTANGNTISTLGTQEPLLAKIAAKSALPPRLKALVKRSLSLNIEERPVDMREFLKELSLYEGPFYQVHADGFVEFDLEWLELFPQELQQTIKTFTDNLENQALGWQPEKFYDSDIELNGRDGPKPMISRELINDWYQRKHSIEVSRVKLVDYWQQHKNTQQGKLMAEFLTAIEYRVQSVEKKEQAIVGYLSIAETEYQQYGLAQPIYGLRAMTLDSPYRTVQETQDYPFLSNSDKSGRQAFIKTNQAPLFSIYNPDGSIYLYWARGHNQSLWEIYQSYSTAVKSADWEKEKVTYGIKGIEVLGKILETEVTSPEKAQEIMGPKQFLGAEAIEKTFGIKLKQEDIPLVPFTAQELERAQRAGMVLMLQVDKNSNGKDLTINQMVYLIKAGKKFTSIPEISTTSGVKSIINKERPKKRWVLTFKENAKRPNEMIDGYRGQLSMLKNDFYFQKIRAIKNPYVPKGEEIDSLYANTAELVYQILMLYGTVNLPEGIGGRSSTETLYMHDQSGYIIQYLSPRQLTGKTASILISEKNSEQITGTTPVVTIRGLI